MSFLKPSPASVLIVSAVLSLPLAMQGQSLTFTTFAGSEGGVGSDDGTGSAARFTRPSGVAADDSGNVYVADTYNSTIRKVTPAGAVTTLAGLAGSSGSTDGTGSGARFSLPHGVATDRSANVYVADSGSHTVRKITAAGRVSTLAGLAGSAGSADGKGSAARFDYPYGVATDSSGNVYVADAGNSTIRKITPAGVVTTLAGLAGIEGSTDGTGSAARFDYPLSVATDGSGNVYVAESEKGTIRKITPTGAVTTLAVQFAAPGGVAADHLGNIYVADTGNHTIQKITPEGAVTTLAGNEGNTGSADGWWNDARFSRPFGVATDSSGNVYVADTENNTIRKITPQQEVTTLAGNASSRGSADGSGLAARFYYPTGVATDAGGNVYVADAGNHTIRKITPAGAVTTLAGRAGSRGSADGTGSEARFYFPFAVATDRSGNVYVADTGNSTIRKITPAGTVTTLAGLAGIQGSTDGTGSNARFYGPAGVATDSSGNVYVAETSLDTIRKITPAGVVTTLAGRAGSRGSSDGTGSAARFDGPYDVATDSSDNVYVADVENQTIRKISPAGVVTTFAGFAGHFGNADGTGTAARFKYPKGVATDNSGNVYVADTLNNTMRKITPAGVVTTLAGLAGTWGSVDGTGAATRFDEPHGAAIDSGGNVYVADAANHNIRIGKAVLPDVATIDVSAGLSGSTRLLDTAPQTATSWQWSVIRRPADSVAILSSGSVRSPTFTPDVPGLFTFRLIATGANSASITTVDLLVRQPERRRTVRK